MKEAVRASAQAVDLFRRLLREQVLAIPLRFEPRDDILELDRKRCERSGFRVQFAPLLGKEFSSAAGSLSIS